jgi:hypothetical protein
MAVSAVRKATGAASPHTTARLISATMTALLTVRGQPAKTARSKNVRANMSAAVAEDASKRTLNF